MRLRGRYGVEVIATGDEILFGRVVDTNSSWIARRASELGARLRRITCVGDDVDEIARVLGEALARGSDLIVFTGGLGPSEDDVTVQAIGRAVGRDVVRDPEAVDLIRRRCAELGVEPTHRRERMARILEGSRPLLNPVGMACGMVLEEGGTTIVALPGVPQEMKAMFDGYVAPMIEAGATTRFQAETVTVRIVWGDFFPMYRLLQQEFKEIYLKNEATPPLGAEERGRVQEIKVDIVVEADSRAGCEEKMRAFLREFRRRVEESGGELITQ